MTVNWMRAGACAITLAFAAGCSGEKTPPPIVPVEGVVLMGNVPMKNVRVRFVPVGDFPMEYVAVGATDNNGKFTLTCHGQPGACTGENMVVVEEGEIPEELKSKFRGEQGRIPKMEYLASLPGRPIPRQYLSLAETPLRVTVTPEETTYTISLIPNK